MDDGYAIHEGVLSAYECREILSRLDALPIRRGRAGAQHLMSSTAVWEIAHDPRLTVLAGGVPYRATLFEKTSTANWSVVWHQDTALPLRSRFDLPGWGPWSMKEGILYAHAPTWALECIVALRVHLDAATAENGALRVLPGSHLRGVLSDVEVLEQSRRSPHVDCLVGRGGVMAMRPMLIHSSRKARYDSPRRILHLEYADSLHLAPGIDLALA